MADVKLPPLRTKASISCTLASHSANPRPPLPSHITCPLCFSPRQRLASPSPLIPNPSARRLPPSSQRRPTVPSPPALQQPALEVLAPFTRQTPPKSDVPRLPRLSRDTFDPRRPDPSRAKIQEYKNSRQEYLVTLIYAYHRGRGFPNPQHRPSAPQIIRGHN